MLFLFFAGVLQEASAWPPVEQTTHSPLSFNQANVGAYSISTAATPDSFDITEQTNTGLSFTQTATPNAWSIS